MNRYVFEMIGCTARKEKKEGGKLADLASG